MVGGSEAAFERAKPVFEKMGKNITLVGANGVGQTTKVANQMIAALTIEAVAEALAFAVGRGSWAKAQEALMGGLAASRILEVHGERMIKRTFAPGFRIELHQKDLNLALDGAKALGVALPNTASDPGQLFNSCRAANGGGRKITRLRAWSGWRDMKRSTVGSMPKASKLPPKGGDPRATSCLIALLPYCPKNFLAA